MSYEQTGIWFKERGMALADGAEDEKWKKQCDATIEWFAMKRIPFTAEDVRAYVGAPSHPNAMGARFHAAAKRGIIVKAGRVKAQRAERHANEMSSWVGP